jgi:hypothetical protein
MNVSAMSFGTAQYILLLVCFELEWSRQPWLVCNTGSLILLVPFSGLLNSFLIKSVPVDSSVGMADATDIAFALAHVTGASVRCAAAGIAVSAGFLGGKDVLGALSIFSWSVDEVPPLAGRFEYYQR